MSELNKLRKDILDHSIFIQKLFSLSKEEVYEKILGHLLIVSEVAIEEFENICATYEETTKNEHPEWSKYGEDFSDEWFKLNKLFCADKEEESE